MNRRIPILIDCDPGVDDAYALLMAFVQPELEILGITTVAGNMATSVTTENALKIVSFANKDIPVISGCTEPIVRNTMPHSELFHGKNGMGNAELPETTRTAIDKNYLEQMVQYINEYEGSIHLVALGPLTNIALLFKIYPQLKPKIHHLTIMGGGRYNGNITREAEFNFFCDAEAAKVVLNSGIDMTLIDLDGCQNAMLSKAEADVILNIPSKITDFVKKMWQFNLELALRIGDEGFVIHDSIALASVFDPQMIQTEKCFADVSTADDETYGKLIVTPDERGNIKISTKTNKERFINLCCDVMKKYSE